MHLLATVVSARQARLAFVADNIRLNGYSVSRLQMSDGGMHGNDLAGRLVAEDVVALNDHRADTSVVPEMHVRPVTVRIGLGCSGVGIHTRRYQCS